MVRTPTMVRWAWSAAGDARRALVSPLDPPTSLACGTPPGTGDETVNDLSLQQLISRGLAWLLVAGLHGWVVASLAALRGDRGPEYDGRRTLNPFVHLDLLGLLAALSFATGWIRPVRIDPAALRRSTSDTVLIMVSGLAAPLALAWLLRLARPLLFAALPPNASIPVLAFMNAWIEVSLRFVALNVWPVPPLAASRLWSLALPAMPGRRRAAEWAGRVVLLAGLALGLHRGLVTPLANLMARAIGLR